MDPIVASFMFLFWILFWIYDGILCFEEEVTPFRQLELYMYKKDFVFQLLYYNMYPFLMITYVAYIIMFQKVTK